MVNLSHPSYELKEGVAMRYLVTIIWALILGQVVGFLGGALTSTPYDFQLTLIFSFIVALLIILIGQVAMPEEKNNPRHS